MPRHICSTFRGLLAEDPSAVRRKQAKLFVDVRRMPPPASVALHFCCPSACVVGPRRGPRNPSRCAPARGAAHIGSAKCNAFRTAEPTDAVIAAVYEIPTNEKPALDDAEGLGSGYYEEIVRVLSAKGEEVVVCTYIADASFIDDSLQPYSWYKDFVLAGAEEHQLPPEYVESRIRAVQAIRDPDPQREQARRAEIKAQVAVPD